MWGFFTLLVSPLPSSQEFLVPPFFGGVGVLLTYFSFTWYCLFLTGLVFMLLIIILLWPKLSFFVIGNILNSFCWSILTSKSLSMSLKFEFWVSVFLYPPSLLKGISGATVPYLPVMLKTPRVEEWLLTLSALAQYQTILHNATKNTHNTVFQITLKHWFDIISTDSFGFLSHPLQWCQEFAGQEPPIFFLKYQSDSILYNPSLSEYFMFCSSQVGVPISKSIDLKCDCDWRPEPLTSVLFNIDNTLGLI